MPVKSLGGYILDMKEVGQESRVEIKPMRREECEVR